MGLMNGPIEVNPKNNPYTRTLWEDDLTDPVTLEVLEEGTTFWAEFANNMEWGIYNAYVFLAFMYREIEKMQALLELDGRAPGNNGTFADIFDEGNGLSRLVRLTTKTDITAAITAGSVVVIPVANTNGFEAMTYATIYDADNYEHVTITAVDAVAHTITVQTLMSEYSKGAKIARSTASVNTTNQTLDVAPFATFSIELVEVV